MPAEPASTAVLFSSHQLQDIETVCNAVVMIDRGWVVAAGPVPDLIAQHGGACIEITVDGTTTIVDGGDVPAAITGATGGSTS